MMWWGMGPWRPIGPRVRNQRTYIRSSPEYRSSPLAARKVKGGSRPMLSLAPVHSEALVSVDLSCFDAN